MVTVDEVLMEMADEISMNEKKKYVPKVLRFSKTREKKSARVTNKMARRKK